MPMTGASSTHLVLIPSYNPGVKLDETVRSARTIKIFGREALLQAAAFVEEKMSAIKGGGKVVDYFQVIGTCPRTDSIDAHMESFIEIVGSFRFV